MANRKSSRCSETAPSPRAAARGQGRPNAGHDDRQCRYSRSGRARVVRRQHAIGMGNVLGNSKSHTALKIGFARIFVGGSSPLPGILGFFSFIINNLQRSNKNSNSPFRTANSRVQCT